MPELVTLDKDGPLGKAGDRVWVDSPGDVEPKKPARKTAASKADDGEDK